MRTTDLLLSCPQCGAALLADDDFCEACGAPISASRDRERRHVEFDSGRGAAITDVGRVHTRNDDAFVLDVTRAGRTVAVVCDGVSTAAAAQAAAAVACRAMADVLIESSGGDAVMNAAFRSADEAVRALPWASWTDTTGPACTAVAAVHDGDQVTVGWAGDSRAYWCAGGGVVVLTTDHSWATEQVAAGRMTSVEAGADRRAHTITRWIGEQGLDDGTAVVSVAPSTVGRLVLCSDGLWNHVPLAEELAALATGPAAPIDAARLLVDTAIERGGTDNVTVVVIELAPSISTGPKNTEAKRLEEG